MANDAPGYTARVPRIIRKTSIDLTRLVLRLQRGIDRLHIRRQPELHLAKLSVDPERDRLHIAGTVHLLQNRRSLGLAEQPLDFRERAVLLDLGRVAK